MSDLKSEHDLAVVESRNVYGPRYQTWGSLPAILLRGKWLLKAGFRAGDRAYVRVYEDRIVIERRERLCNTRES